MQLGRSFGLRSNRNVTDAVDMFESVTEIRDIARECCISADAASQRHIGNCSLSS
jgi:hypothetical protein